MNRFIEMTDSELSEALENTIISIESSDGAGDWLDAVIEARRRLSMQAAVQTFYVIKRDEEPSYWNPGFGWQEKPMLTTSAGEHNRWKRDLDLKALLPTNPTARIVKVMVSEVEG